MLDALPTSEKKTGSKNILDIIKRFFEISVNELYQGSLKEGITKFRNLTQRTDTVALKEAIDYLYSITKKKMEEVLGDKEKDEISESGLTGEEMMTIAF